MNYKQTLIGLLICISAITSCDTQKQLPANINIALFLARQTLDALYANYSVPGTCLLR